MSIKALVLVVVVVLHFKTRSHIIFRGNETRVYKQKYLKQLSFFFLFLENILINEFSISIFLLFIATRVGVIKYHVGAIKHGNVT